MIAHNFDAERISKLETQLVELQTQNHYMANEIEELKASVKESNEAINTLNEKMSAGENHTKTVQWFVMALIGVASVIVGNFI